MQNNVNSNISWYEGHTITSLGKILKFSKFYVQIIWQVVRWWHHQLTHFHIHIDWSRNVLWKFAKLQSVITSLFFNQFSSGFHCYVWNILLFLLKFKLYLFRISPLIMHNLLSEAGGTIWIDGLPVIVWHTPHTLPLTSVHYLNFHIAADLDQKLTSIFRNNHELLKT